MKGTESFINGTKLFLIFFQMAPKLYTVHSSEMVVLKQTLESGVFWPKRNFSLGAMKY